MVGDSGACGIGVSMVVFLPKSKTIDQSAFGYKNHLWHFQEKARVGWEQAISRVSVHACT